MLFHERVSSVQSLNQRKKIHLAKLAKYYQGIINILLQNFKSSSLLVITNLDFCTGFEKYNVDKYVLPKSGVGRKQKESTTKVFAVSYHRE